MKSSNIVTKRVRVTKNNKVLHRACGQNHFNAKESSKVTRGKRRPRQLSKAYRRTVLRAF
jgi:ribosomal protein L35